MSGASRLFFRLIVRPLAGEPVRTGLTVLAVSLGVAVVLAIELAGGAAAGSFRSSMESLAGHADFEVTGNGGVPPEALARSAAIAEETRLIQHQLAEEMRQRFKDQPAAARLPGLPSTVIAAGRAGAAETPAIPVPAHTNGGSHRKLTITGGRLAYWVSGSFRRSN
jgi:hypothetical protein